MAGIRQVHLVVHPDDLGFEGLGVLAFFHTLELEPSIAEFHVDDSAIHSRDWIDPRIVQSLSFVMVLEEPCRLGKLIHDWLITRSVRLEGVNPLLMITLVSNVLAFHVFHIHPWSSDLVALWSSAVNTLNRLCTSGSSSDVMSRFWITIYTFLLRPGPVVSYLHWIAGNLSHSFKDQTWSASPAAIAGVRFCQRPSRPRSRKVRTGQQKLYRYIVK
jgi:hypothetical protein